MAKIIIKQVVEAVTETVLRQLMPELDQRIDALRSELHATRRDITALDAKVDGLRSEMLDRFEPQLHTINEVSHGVTKVDSRLEGYMRGLQTVISPVKILLKRKAS